MIVFLCVTYIAARDRNSYEEKKSKLEENQKRGVEITEKISHVVNAKRDIDHALNESVQKARQILATGVCDGVSDFNVNPEDLSLTIEFKKGNLSWFKSGKWVPEPPGQTCLKAFVPLWLGELYKLKSSRTFVEQLVIEGHTDRLAPENVDPFLYNLELSQNRSLEVARFILDSSKIRIESYNSYSEITGDWTNFRGWLDQHLTATGRSFSKPKEDNEKSRRVEFKIVMKDQLRVIEKILKDSSGKEI